MQQEERMREYTEFSKSFYMDNRRSHFLLIHSTVANGVIITLISSLPNSILLSVTACCVIMYHLYECIHSHPHSASLQHPLQYCDNYSCNSSTLHFQLNDGGIVYQLI